MRKRKSVFDDPVVDEVRAIRAKLWREAGMTMEGLRELNLNGEARKKKRSRKAKPATTRAKSTRSRSSKNGKGPR